MSGKRDERLKLMMKGSYVARAGQVCTAVAMVMFACYASAQDVPDQEVLSPSASVVERYPAGSIKSVKEADAALADVDRERARVNARFTVEEQACHSRFFATSCIDGVKERRRQALLQLRGIDIEARAFKRQARAVHRDRVLVARPMQPQADLLMPGGNTNTPSVKSAHGGEPGESSDIVNDVQGAAFTERSKKHEAPLKRMHTEDAASAKKRAENIEAYEKKVRAAQVRQSEIQIRKAEKERKRRIKQAPLPDLR